MLDPLLTFVSFSLLQGSIELKLEVCTEVEASNAPAGLGHQPPMALPKPQ